MMNKKIYVIFGILMITSILYSGRVFDIEDGTVVDNDTGLRWTRCPMVGSGAVDPDADCLGKHVVYSWQDAVTACENLDYKGINQWRLPNIRELHSIVTYLPALVEMLDTSVFLVCPIGDDSGVQHSHFWSSTTYAGNPDRAWSFDFLWGSSPPRFKTATAFVRCVTGP